METHEKKLLETLRKGYEEELRKMNLPKDKDIDLPTYIKGYLEGKLDLIDNLMSSQSKKN